MFARDKTTLAFLSQDCLMKKDGNEPGYRTGSAKRKGLGYDMLAFTGQSPD